VAGELRLLGSAVPIERGLSDPDLTEEQRSKLEFVVRARDYGRDVVGLNVANSYQTFVNLRGVPLAFNLSASRKDRFEPYIWNLVIGPFPYLGFFDEREANRERDRLVRLGYDTVTYEVDAFSTLGLLPDPVTSALLRRDLASLADTVLHELTHNTISKLADTNFNETLANFVGRAAAIEFLQQEFGDDAEIVRLARERYEDSDRLGAFYVTLIDELTALYDSDLSSEEKIERRTGVVQAARERYRSEVLPLMHDQATYAAYGEFPINNAYLLLHVRYNDQLDLFQGVYDFTGRNWGQTLQVFSDAAAVEDSLGYLRGILGEAE
jgi:predicted aminopeptidase